MSIGHRLRFAVGTALVALSISGWPPPAHAATQVPCQQEPAGEDGRSFRCPLPAPGRYRFEAVFAGGHDDTVASMEPTLDDAPLDCDPESKTRLAGEDGDVSLHCRFSIRSDAGRPVLGVRVKWSHARYTRAVLVLD